MSKSKIPFDSNGNVDIDVLREKVDWQELSEVEKIILTGQELDWQLLNREVQLNADLARIKWGNGNTLLCLAAHDGQLALVELLIDAGANINANSELGTPLYCGVWSSQGEIVDRLIQEGANLNSHCDNGWTPLHLACRNGYEKIAESLIRAGAKINAKDSSGRTPLDEAAQQEYAEVARLVVAHGGAGTAETTSKYVTSLGGG
ncbi:ankyrin repeat domain-containing protein [Bremerella sp. T1]|uniref:ankyrin repeat domain-containing protein n=1 Tax=Bremerella sp. TYQ1 TaxID=3119568 RepID=UPI001CCCD4E9|nr:ankyrin repeat domain-containing protein [Bremerella volcania]UBM37668.1 ankyrin repeat domain-containing protein [Bremerella volcania]